MPHEQRAGETDLKCGPYPPSSPKMCADSCLIGNAGQVLTGLKSNEAHITQFCLMECRPHTEVVGDTCNKLSAEEAEKAQTDDGMGQDIHAEAVVDIFAPAPGPMMPVPAPPPAPPAPAAEEETTTTAAPTEAAAEPTTAAPTEPAQETTTAAPEDAVITDTRKANALKIVETAVADGEQVKKAIGDAAKTAAKSADGAEGHAASAAKSAAKFDPMADAAKYSGAAAAAAAALLHVKGHAPTTPAMSVSVAAKASFLRPPALPAIKPAAHA